jgi:hypothetical protein
VLTQLPLEVLFAPLRNGNANRRGVEGPGHIRPLRVNIPLVHLNAGMPSAIVTQNRLDVRAYSETPLTELAPRLEAALNGLTEVRDQIDTHLNGLKTVSNEAQLTEMHRVIAKIRSNLDHAIRARCGFDAVWMSRDNRHIFKGNVAVLLRSTLNGMLSDLPTEEREAS